MLTVNGDTALLRGHWEVLSPLFLEKKQTVPWRTAVCLTALAAPTQWTCTLDKQREAVISSVLVDWNAEVLLMGYGQSLACELGAKTDCGGKGRKSGAYPLLCFCLSCFPSLSLSYCREMRGASKRNTGWSDREGEELREETNKGENKIPSQSFKDS